MTQSKIVILEADQHRRDYIRSIVSNRGYVPYIFEKETICLDNLMPLDPDLVISGPLSSERVCRFVNTVKMKNGNLPVLIISGDRTVRDDAMSNGFGDVKVIKVNFAPSEINGAINNLLQARIANHGNGNSESPMIIGSSPEIIKIKKQILDLKDSREPVLIQGEPGTGKELVARALHFHSDKRHRPFVKINLAELDDLLWRAEPYFWTKLRPFRKPINQGCSTYLRMAIPSKKKWIRSICDSLKEERLFQATACWSSGFRQGSLGRTCFTA
jgi:DNA-binding NtrC family response regulator